MKLVAVSGFMLLALLINWRVTQYAARLFGYARALGPPLVVRALCAMGMDRLVVALALASNSFQPVWELCIRAGGLSAVRARVRGTAGAIVIARYLLSGTRFRSAWFGALGDDARRARGGLIAPRRYLPR